MSEIRKSPRYHSITDDVFKQTMLDQFVSNYQKLQSRNDGFTEKITRSFFVGSTILEKETDKQRAILYLNLPYNQVIAKKLKPVKISQGQTFNETIEQFENPRYEKAPNLILFKSNKQIFGGFANDSWSLHTCKKGNSSCFLFNLTENMRFNARENMSHYIEVNKPTSSIHFGEKELVISVSIF